MNRITSLRADSMRFEFTALHRGSSIPWAPEPPCAPEQPVQAPAPAVFGPLRPASLFPAPPRPRTPARVLAPPAQRPLGIPLAAALALDALLASTAASAGWMAQALFTLPDPSWAYLGAGGFAALQAVVTVGTGASVGRWALGIAPVRKSAAASVWTFAGDLLSLWGLAVLPVLVARPQALPWLRPFFRARFEPRGGSR